MPRVGLRLTPHGHLIAEDQDDAPEMDAAIGARLTEAFASGAGPGLVRLGAGEVGQALPPVFVWWRSFATRYIGAVCLNAPGREEDAAVPVIPPLDAGELASLVMKAGPVCILCYERDHAHCHRQWIADACAMNTALQERGPECARH